jgi:hypothetical protein
LDDITNYAVITAEMVRVDEGVSGTPVSIPLKPCLNTDVGYFYDFNQDQKEMIELHWAENQFMCADTSNFDMEVFNKFDALNSQVININFRQCLREENANCELSGNKKAYFDIKQLMVILNSETIDFNEKMIKETKKEATLHWLPVTMSDYRYDTKVTMQRFTYFPEANPFAKMFGYAEDDVYGVQVMEDNKHFDTTVYAASQSDPFMMHRVVLDASQSRVMMVARTTSWLRCFPWIGGWFAFLWALAYVMFYLVMNFLTYLDVIIKIFKIDPAKGQTPRDPQAVDRSRPGDLLTMAQNRLKERVPITRNPLQALCLNTEAAIKFLVTC